MKKTFLLLCVFFAGFFTAVNATENEKIKQSFETTFPTATDVRWSDKNEQIEAYFELADVKCRIRYSPDGKVQSTIRYYSRKQLSPFLTLKIMQRFPELEIFGVTEVSTEEELFFVVVLQDDRQWINVTLSGTGQISAQERYKKLKP
jgi:hypothetical protein